MVSLFNSAQRILKEITITLFLITIGLRVCAQQDQNIGVSGISITPTPTTVGGSLEACFSFAAPNGVTLNLASDEEVRIAVCFNKISQSSISSATPSVTYGLGTSGFLEWTYISALGGNCWVGTISQNLATMSSARVCFSGLSAATSATPTDANNAAGIGFAVNLTPHSRDPSSDDTDDFEEIYTYTVDGSSDLQIVKTVNNPSPRIGDSVVFTIAVSNEGPSVASNVVVTDQIPLGYTLTNASSTKGTWTTATWTVGDLAVGALDTLWLTATVNDVENYTNTASVTSSVPDPVMQNNTSSASTTPVKPGIALVKSGILSQDKNSITYTFIVTNTGDVPLSGISISDVKLPQGIVLDATTLQPQTSATGTVVYTITEGEKVLKLVTNSAIVTGIPPDNTPVSDVSGTTIENDDETVVVIPPDCKTCLTSRATRIK